MNQSLLFSIASSGLTALLLSATLCLAQGSTPSPEPVIARTVKLTNIETSYPHWSPDGRRIVYQSNRTGNSEIYVMNADGSGATRITDHPAVDENPAWSPDGSRIAFRSYRDGNAEIYTMAPDGSELRNLTRSPATDIHPYWSPDGTRILFNSNRTRRPSGDSVPGIYSMRADGSDVRRVSQTIVEETYAQFSPDGSRLVFRRRLDERMPGWDLNPGNSEIFVMGVNGTAERRLTFHPGFDGWPSWSPDGAWITYATEVTRGDYQIAIVRPDGSAMRRITQGPGSFTKPIFSPDGRRIVCTRTLDGNVEIFVLEMGPSADAAHSAGTSTASSPLERAATAMGGVALLSQLPPLATAYHLIERSLGQEEWPDGPAASSAQIGDRVYEPRAAREMLTMKRHMSGGRVYDRVLDAGEWHRLSGRPDVVSGSIGAERALSAALAALHPEALLPRLLANRAPEHTIGRSTMLSGRRVTPLRTRAGTQTVTVFVDDEDGYIRAVEWPDSDLAGREGGSVTATFSQYRPARGVPGEPRLPHLVEVWRQGRLWQVRSYAEFRVASAIPGPAPAPPGATGAVQSVEVAPGFFHLRGSDSNSLLADLGDRVVLVEVPESLERGRAVVDEARRRAAGRPVTVVVTHLHDDHVAGLAAAADFEIIAHELIADHVRSITRAARPNAAPRVTAVKSRVSLGSGAATLELLPVEHSHAREMLVAYVPSAALLFEVDLVRGLLPHSTAELVSWIDANRIPVNTVISSHGAANSWERIATTSREWVNGLMRDSRPRPPE